CAVSRCCTSSTKNTSSRELRRSRLLWVRRNFMPQTAIPTKPFPEALTRYVALSYPLSSRTPYPGGGCPLRLTPTSQLARGDISNTSLVEFWNHMGTHMDGPGHMTSAGP